MKTRFDEDYPRPFTEFKVGDLVVNTGVNHYERYGHRIHTVVDVNIRGSIRTNTCKRGHILNPYFRHATEEDKKAARREVLKEIEQVKI